MRKDTPPERLAVRGPEAARMLGVSVSTVERLRRSGTLPSAKMGGVRVYPVEALKRVLAACAEGGKA